MKNKTTDRKIKKLIKIIGTNVSVENKFKSITRALENKINGIILITFFLFFMALISSCGRGHYFEANIKVPNQTWNYDSIAHFAVPIDDSSKFYRIWIKVKHEEAYPYANLWLKVITKCPCGAIKVDTVNIWFLDQQQRFIGTGIGKTWTVIWPFQDSVKFPTNGTMDVYIQHIMRKNNITGIKEIGVIVDKLK